MPRPPGGANAAAAPGHPGSWAPWASDGRQSGYHIEVPDPAASQPNAGEPAADWSLRFWLALVATGVAAGLGAMAMMAVLRSVQHAVYSYHVGLFSSSVARHGDVRRVVVLLVAGAIAGVGWWVLRHRAGGTGGEPTTSVWTHHPTTLAPPQTLASGALSEVVIGMGASLGREAAPQHIGAASASWIGKRLGLSEAQCMLLVACGAGAGVGAVYNVPLAGGLFAAELYLGSISVGTVVPAIATSAIATVVSWLTLRPKFLYVVPHAAFPAPTTIVFALAAGPVLGFLAAGYVRLVAWATAHRPQGTWREIGAPVLAFGLLGVAAIEYPLLLGNGRDLAQFAFTGTGLLATAAALALMKPLFTSLCLGSGASGGLFTPTFSFGAACGMVFGHLWSLAWPGTPGATDALIGAGAVISAAMDAPVAGIAFAIELTGSTNASIVVVVLAVAGALVVFRRCQSLSIYAARS